MTRIELSLLSDLREIYHTAERRINFLVPTASGLNYNGEGGGEERHFVWENSLF